MKLNQRNLGVKCCEYSQLREKERKNRIFMKSRTILYLTQNFIVPAQICGPLTIGYGIAQKFTTWRFIVSVWKLRELYSHDFFFENSVKSTVSYLHWFHEIFLVRVTLCFFHTTVWKNQKFSLSLTEKKIRQINYLVTSLVKVLLS